MNKVGIILKNLGQNQSSLLLINYLNGLVTQTNEYDFTIFYQEMVPLAYRPLCATMSVAEVYDFEEGILIATNIDSAIALNRCPNSSKKYFYVLDLEWLRGRQNYLYNQEAFNLNLICRSQSHAEAIKHYSGKQVDFIVPNFNIGYITNEINRRKVSV